MNLTCVYVFESNIQCDQSDYKCDRLVPKNNRENPLNWITGLTDGRAVHVAALYSHIPVGNKEKAHTVFAAQLQFHRTRTFHNDIFASAAWQGWQNPISCDDEPALWFKNALCIVCKNCVSIFQNWFRESPCELWNHIVACEGLKQRVVPTCVAAGDNEVSCASGFQRKAFPGSGCQ